MAEGVFGFLSVARQNSFGITNAASYEYIPYVDESLTKSINVLRPETLTGNFNEVSAVRGLEEITGDINVVMEPQMTGVLLRSVFGQVSTTTANVSATFYEHEFLPKNSNFEAGVALTPYTIQAHRDTNKSYEFTDSQIHSLNISLATNDFLKMNVSVITKTSTITSTVTGTAPSNVPFVFDQASISLGGTGNDDFESIEISFANNVAGYQTLNGTRTHRGFARTEKMQVRISGTMNFLNNSDAIDYENFTTQRLFVFMKDTSVASGNELIVDIPQFRFDTYDATVDGTSRISADFTATGEYNTASSYAARITLINSREIY